MPSGLENLDANRFILRYEHPWGGIASDASKEDIAPNQLVACDGMFLRNGRLCSTNLYAFDPSVLSYTALPGQQYWSNLPAEMAVVYRIGNDLFAIDRNLTVYKFLVGLNYWTQVATAADKDGLPLSFTPEYSCSILISGNIYIFDFSHGTEFVFSFMEGSPVGQWTMRQAEQGGYGTGNPPQTFVGGQYCMVLDQYLITAYTNMPGYSYIDPNGNPQTVAGKIRPNGYNWSVPGGYTSFGPSADPTSPMYNQTTDGQTTGYNTLPEVQNEITGCFVFGNVGYILHDQGLTQLTPTGLQGNTSALWPFDPTILFDGKYGVGCTMPQTLAVYGYIAIWGNYNNFYLFMAGAAPQEICGPTKRVIFEDINRFKYTDSAIVNTYGQFANMGVDNNDPELVYNLYIIYEKPPETPSTTIIVWSFVIKTQTWTRTVVNLETVMKEVTGNFGYTGYLSASGFPAASAQNLSLLPTGILSNSLMQKLHGGILLNIASNAGTLDGFWLFQYINQSGIANPPDQPPVTDLIFRSEEFQIYRKPTVRGVILRAAGLGILHVQVGNTKFTDISVNSPNNTSLYRSFGMHTDQAPVIEITSTDFNGYITKVHAFGTYAEGEPL